VYKKLIKNSQLFGKKFQKTAGGDFFDSHCIHPWAGRLVMETGPSRMCIYTVPQN